MDFPLTFLATTSRGSREGKFDNRVTSPFDSPGAAWPAAEGVFAKPS